MEKVSDSGGERDLYVSWVKLHEFEERKGGTKMKPLLGK